MVCEYGLRRDFVGDAVGRFETVSTWFQIVYCGLDRQWYISQVTGCGEEEISMMS
jgi:hypothetical protein